MNDIEKNFQESLRHHEVAPPPAVWDQLNTNLVQKRKKKAVYWRVAAAVTLLLLGTGTLIMLLRSEPPVKIVSQQDQSSASNPEESAVALSERAAAMDSVAIVAPSSAGQVASSVMADQKRVAEEEEQQPLSDEYQQVDARLSQSTETAAQSPNVPSAQEPEGHRVAVLQPIVPEVTNTPLPTTPVNEILPSVEVQLDRSPTEELASSDAPPTAAVAQRRTVTVIYKPGNRLPKATETNQNDKFLSKTLSFLEDVKKNGLAYGELRSAKSELIDNVFSRDRNNQQ